MPQCITAETDAQVEPSPCFCLGREAARHAINSLVKAGVTEKRAKGSGTERPQQGADREHDNENPAAPQPQNRAERRAAARSGKKGSAPATGRGGAKQHGRPSPGTPGGRATGKSAAGTNPHARNRAAQGRQGANRH